MCDHGSRIHLLSLKTILIVRHVLVALVSAQQHLAHHLPIQVFLLPLVQPLSTPMRNTVADWSHPNLLHVLYCVRRIRTRRLLALDRKCTRLAAGAQSPRARISGYDFCTWEVSPGVDDVHPFSPFSFDVLQEIRARLQATHNIRCCSVT